MRTRTSWSSQRWQKKGKASDTSLYIQANLSLYRLLADAQFFDSRISKIDGSGDLGQEIVKVVQAKTVAETGASAPATATSETANGQKDEQEKSAPAQEATEVKGQDTPEDTKS